MAALAAAGRRAVQSLAARRREQQVVHIWAVRRLEQLAVHMRAVRQAQGPERPVNIQAGLAGLRQGQKELVEQRGAATLVEALLGTAWRPSVATLLSQRTETEDRCRERPELLEIVVTGRLSVADLSLPSLEEARKALLAFHL